MRCFNGCFTALITPFLADLSVDFDSLASLVDYQIKSGVTGLVLLGTTAEASLLSDIEKSQIIDCVISRVPENITLIVALSSPTLDGCLANLDELNKISRIDAYMAVTPSYIKPTQSGLVDYFDILATRAAKPFILYNVPGRTSCDLLDATVLTMSAKNINIHGLKDATGNIARCNFMVKRKSDKFVLFSGDDATTVSFILSGGNSAISVVSNVVPLIYSKMCNAAYLGNKPLAIELNNQIEELHSLLFCESNPIPVKYACFYLGLIKTPLLRKPLTTLSEDKQLTLKTTLDKIKLFMDC